MDIYQQQILENYLSPKNNGTLQNSSYFAEGENPLCGDNVSIYVNEDDGKIKDIRFNGKGCAISQASASLLTEAVKGMSIDEVKKLEPSFILDILGISLSPTRQKCALLSLRTLQRAVFEKQADSR